MNSEDKIYNKIKNASQKGEKDFPGMDKVWNRVEEKLDNTIVVKKKNTWQKLAIAATVLLSFSIIYHFVSNDEIIKDKINNSNNANENPVLVSKDSVNKIIEKAREAVVANEDAKMPSSKIQLESNPIENNPFTTSFAPVTSIINDSAVKIKYDFDPITSEDKEAIVFELNKNLSTENKLNYNNSALNSSSSNTNNGYYAPSKKYNTTTKPVKPRYKASSAKSKDASEESSDELVVIDGVVKNKKELDKISPDDIEITHYAKPLYIINGTEYTEESLFGKKPTSPYAPLDKQEIITINVVKAEDAMKVYGKKGENGVIIITTKDGKPVKK